MSVVNTTALFLIEGIFIDTSRDEKRQKVFTPSDDQKNDLVDYEEVV